MWTDTTRAIHARKGLCLPSNLTDEEWTVLEPFLPPASSVGRPRKWPMRRIVEAMLYLLRGGLPWRMLPPGFPPATTVQRYFYAWRDSGLWQTINHYLLMAIRVAEGREASPSAGVIDSQSVKTTDPAGFAATTRARRSRAANATFSPTHAAISFTPWFTRLIFKTATVRRWS